MIYRPPVTRATMPILPVYVTHTHMYCTRVRCTIRVAAFNHDYTRSSFLFDYYNYSANEKRIGIRLSVIAAATRGRSF